jgi:DNA polymerase-3 subunit beta
MIVLKAPQQKLLEALQSVAGIVERRHTLPILANVLLRKNGGTSSSPPATWRSRCAPAPTLGGDAGSSAPRWVRAS